MNSAVLFGALLVAVLNALPALLGAWRWYRGGESRAFWVLLRVGQIAAVVFVVAVGLLAAAGRSSTEHLFYLYALLPVAVAFIAEQRGQRVERRDEQRAGHDGAVHTLLTGTRARRLRRGRSALVSRQLPLCNTLPQA